MSQARGYLAVVGLYEETTYATVPGSPDGKKLYIVSSTLSPSRPLIQSQTLRGDRTLGAPDADNLDVSGDITTEIGTENIGYLLKHLLGSVGNAGVGPYTHTFTTGASLPVGLMLERDHTASIASAVERFQGLRIASATFDFPQKGYPTVKWSVKGANYALVAAPADATLTDSGQSSMSAFTASIQEGGSAFAKALKASLTLNNDLDDSQYVIGGGAAGAGTRASLPEGFLIGTGMVTAQFDSLTLLNKAVNGIASEFYVQLSRGTGDGSAGNEFFSLDFKNIKYELAGPQITGPKGITVDLKFQLYAAGGNYVTAVLKNQTASY